MAEITKPPRTRRRTKIGRIRISLNVVVQIVLVLFLAAMLNSFAFKHYKRWVFSRAEGKNAHHSFLFAEYTDHRGRSESAHRISVRREGKSRRRAYRSGAESFPRQGVVRQIQGRHRRESSGARL